MRQQRRRPSLFATHTVRLVIILSRLRQYDSLTNITRPEFRASIYNKLLVSLNEGVDAFLGAPSLTSLLPQVVEVRIRKVEPLSVKRT